MRTAVAAGLGLALAMPPSVALAGKRRPTQVVPQKKNGATRRQERRSPEDQSEGGTRRGILEISLGSVVLGTSALLVGRGAWEIVESRRFAEECESGRSNAVSCGLLNPRRNGSIAAGLSFGFAGVLTVAGGFLLARGIRINRDYRTFQRANANPKAQAPEARLRVMPWGSVRQRSGGLSLRLRF